MISPSLRSLSKSIFMRFAQSTKSAPFINIISLYSKVTIDSRFLKLISRIKIDKCSANLQADRGCLPYIQYNHLHYFFHKYSKIVIFFIWWFIAKNAIICIVLNKRSFTLWSTISFLRNLPQQVVTFLGMGLIMIFGTAPRQETNLPCQGMANRKCLPEWNVKQERFFWGSNPPTFCALLSKGL